MDRWLRPVFTAFAFVALTFGSGAARAEVCTCMSRLGGACEVAWEADAVFVGTVTSITDLGPDEKPANSLVSRRVRFGSVERFLGDLGAEPAALTGPGRGGDCGYPFEVGRQYLVYAHRGPDGLLSTSICTRTAEVRNASEDLAYLRSLSTPATSTAGRLFGTVDRTAWTLADPAERRVPIAGQRVSATGTAGTYEATSGVDGSFSIDVPPGEYVIESEAPGGHHVVIWPSPAKVANARACVGIGVRLRFDGRVTGRVLQPSGEPAAGLAVRLAMMPEEPHGLMRTADTGRTDADGWYEFVHVEPGAYLLGADTQEPDTERGPTVEPLYFGADASAGGARPLDVGRGTRHAIPAVTLPAGADAVTLEGTVVDALGQPLQGIGVSVRLRSPDATLGSFPRTDERGRFVLRLRRGIEYELVLRRRIGRELQVQTEPLQPLTGPSTMTFRFRGLEQITGGALTMSTGLDPEAAVR